MGESFIIAIANILPAVEYIQFLGWAGIFFHVRQANRHSVLQDNVKNEKIVDRLKISPRLWPHYGNESATLYYNMVWAKFIKFQ
jgi:hypothetical protein